MSSDVNFRDLHCWKIWIEVSLWVHKACKNAGLDPSDELAMRRNIAAMNIPGKIAFAYGPHDTQRLIEYLPVATKYAAETGFWSRVAYKKGIINKNELYMVEEQLTRIIKKISSIQNYLEKYGKEEQYQRKMMFNEKGEE